MNNKILVVDDSKLYKTVIKDWLSEKNYDTIFANSGEQAIEIFYKNKADISLIILDIELGGINGLEVCKKLRVINKSDELSIIILTSYTDKNIKETAYSSGADDYLVKPVDKNILLEKVSFYIKNTGSFNKGNILLIEDNVTLSLLIKMSLKNNGYHVENIKDWKEENFKINDLKKFDVIILDIFLPQTDGVNVLKEIRKHEDFKFIPIIGITAKKDLKILKNFFELGGTDFLIKPLMIEELVSRISAHLNFSKINKELEQNNLELSELFRQKEKTFNFIVHELRNPLSIIYNASELLEQTHISDGNKEKEIIKLIKENTLNLSGMVDSILDISKINLKNSNLVLDEINFKKIVDEVFKELIILAKSKNIDLKNNIIGELKFKADYKKIKTIIQNLISNSIKYSDSGNIELNAFINEKEDIVVIAVKDQGIGIPDNMKNEIFEEYKRVSPKSDIKGTGIGLHLVKKLIEAHNGKIWVENNVNNNGSVFIINLPFL